jgi:D-amino-acid oxidase
MSSRDLDRRRLIQSSLAFSGLGVTNFSLAGCTTPSVHPSLNRAGLAVEDIPLPPAPMRAHPDRVFDITVCLRPCRAQGPRIEGEQIGDILVVHNYGHAASGWSLSWGSANLAIQKALVNSPTHVAVIGCGVIGLTSAIMAQRAGVAVTIYARDLLPQTRSSRAQAFWGPSGSIALKGSVSPQFGDQWEQMARFSFKTYRQYLGLPGRPVEWRDQYSLSDVPFEQEREAREKLDAPDFVNYSSRLADLVPRAQELPEGATPFPVRYVRRSESMVFNIPEYSHMLMRDFFAAGGKFARKEFHAPNDLTQLSEKVVINCPGYAAREWWNDNTITPKRGQIAWLIPQPEVNYGLTYKGTLVTSRRDAIAVQDTSGGEMQGYNNSSELADRTEADHAVGALAGLFSRFRS